MKIPSQQLLYRIKNELSYDPTTGVVTWLFNHGFSGKYPAGSTCGTKYKSSRGRTSYLCVNIDGTILQVHHIAWFLETGSWPSSNVDHEDTDGLNNRWTNLRLATKQQNMANRAVQRNSKSGLKGVRRHGEKWRACIAVDGRRVRHLGIFDTAEAASTAYLEAAKERYGDFARGA